MVTIDIVVINLDSTYMGEMSTIQLQVERDNENILEKIEWSASNTYGPEQFQSAKAVLFSCWDGTEKKALCLNMWTKRMIVDEMTDFFYETLKAMANTYEDATGNKDQAKDLHAFAKEFYGNFALKQELEKIIQIP